MNGPWLWLEDDPAGALSTALAALRESGTVVFPTDTVYGLLAASDSQHGYQQIYRIKQRPPDKPLALLASPSALTTQAEAQLAFDPRAAQAFASGTLTLILAPQLLPALPPHISAIQSGAIGLRCPQHTELLQLLGQLGGLLWATSVNESDSPPAAWAGEVQDWLAQATPGPTLAVLSRRPLTGTPSRVAELRVERLHYLR